MSAEHWRSLGELEESAESRAFREREFPEGASEAPEGVSRRTVLTLLGASAGAAGLVACRRPEEHIVPYVEPPEQVMPGVPRHYATSMPNGTSAYGLVVESHEAAPPSSRATSCTRRASARRALACRPPSSTSTTRTALSRC